MGLIKDIVLNFSVGAGVGILFFFLKLPIPAPPVIPPVFAILGITVGYLFMANKFL